jgi:hypothetical protein
MRYRLRTLLILLAVGPPIVANVYFSLLAQQPYRDTLVTISGNDDWLPWYPPGTPQASALCKQSAERRSRRE